MRGTAPQPHELNARLTSDFNQQTCFQMTCCMSALIPSQKVSVSDEKTERLLSYFFAGRGFEFFSFHVSLNARLAYSMLERLYGHTLNPDITHAHTDFQSA